MDMNMDDDTRICLIVIVGFAIVGAIEWHALDLGIDGVMLTGTISGIIGVVSWAVKGHIEKKKRGKKRGKKR